LCGTAHEGRFIGPLARRQGGWIGPLVGRQVCDSTRNRQQDFCDGNHQLVCRSGSLNRQPSLSRSLKGHRHP
jgi:hypothetical protein